MPLSASQQGKFRSLGPVVFPQVRRLCSLYPIRPTTLRMESKKEGGGAGPRGCSIGSSDTNKLVYVEKYRDGGGVGTTRGAHTFHSRLFFFFFLFFYLHFLVVTKGSRTSLTRRDLLADGISRISDNFYLSRAKQALESRLTAVVG